MAGPFAQELCGVLQSCILHVVAPTEPDVLLLLLQQLLLVVVLYVCAVCSWSVLAMMT